MQKHTDRYQSSLEQAEQNIDGLTPSEILNLLHERDQIAASLAASSLATAKHVYGHIVDLDKRLKSLGPRLVKRAGSGAFKDWRESLQSSSPGWWWNLDESLFTTEDQRNAGLLLLTALVLAVTLAYTSDVATRILSGGPDAKGFLLTGAQVCLTFIAGTAFTQTGRTWVKDFSSLIGIPHRWQPGISCLLAFCVLVGVYQFKRFLPSIADGYHANGLAHMRRNRVSAAIDNYKRAIALDPDNKATHYDLGFAYEKILDYDDAMLEYQRAIQIDGHYTVAYNNLARLFIVKNADYGRALAVLNSIVDVNGTVHSSVPEIVCKLPALTLL